MQDTKRFSITSFRNKVPFHVGRNNLYPVQELYPEKGVGTCLGMWAYVINNGNWTLSTKVKLKTMTLLHSSALYVLCFIFILKQPKSNSIKNMPTDYCQATNVCQPKSLYLHYILLCEISKVIIRMLDCNLKIIKSYYWHSWPFNCRMSAWGTYRDYSVQRPTVLLISGEPLGRKGLSFSDILITFKFPFIIWTVLL